MAHVTTDNASFPTPGSDVMVVGLSANAQFNGEQGVVQDRELWPDNGRVAVLLPNVEPPKSLSIRASNLRAWVRSCFVCLEHDDGESSPLLQTGCGCRGSAGWIHGRCAILAASAQQERAHGDWAGIGKHPWQRCPTCHVPYTGPLKLTLAHEWCRRTEHLPASDLQRFAARTTLGNALQAAGELHAAEAVVRSSLEAAKALHGPESRMALGTTMNLGLLLSSLGRLSEAESLFHSALEVQRRQLGADHADTLATGMQMANMALSSGRHAAAEAQYRELLPVHERVLGCRAGATLCCQMNLASALLNQGKLLECAAAFESP